MTRGIGPKEKFDIVYKGWAPCFHGKADELRIRPWLERVFAHVNDVGDEDGFFINLDRYLDQPLVRDGRVAGGGLEGWLLWAICILGGNPTLYADQWIAVTTRGTIEGRTVYTDIQADYPMIGLAETYRWWSDKGRELRTKDNGSKPPDAQNKVPTDIGLASPSQESGLAGGYHGVKDTGSAE